MTPCGPKDAPHNRQWDCPSPHAVFLMLSSRLERRLRTHGNRCKHKKKLGVTPKTTLGSESISARTADLFLCNGDNSFPSHSILSCSVASIMAARARTPLMISFSSSVSSSPGGPPDMFIVLSILNPKHTKREACKVKMQLTQKGQRLQKVHH